MIIYHIYGANHSMRKSGVLWIRSNFKRFDENERFLLLEVDGYQNGYKNVIL